MLNAINNKEIEKKIEKIEKINAKGIIYNLFSIFMYSLTNPLLKILFLYNKQISEYEVLYWKSFSMMMFNYIF